MLLVVVCVTILENNSDFIAMVGHKKWPKSSTDVAQNVSKRMIFNVKFMQLSTDRNYLLPMKYEENSVTRRKISVKSNNLRHRRAEPQ